VIKHEMFLRNRRKTMPRYIDAEPFGCISWKGIPEGYDDSFDSGVLYVADLIDDAPTISPDEVRVKGKWIVEQTAIGKDYTLCSVCKTDFKFRTDKGTLAQLDMRGMPFCPQCGSKMEVSKDA
jgi:hypothetical protein